MSDALSQTRAAGHGNKRYYMRHADYRAIQRIIRETTGIPLGDAKKDMVTARLYRRVRAMGCRDFGDYVRMLESKEFLLDEIDHLVNCLTTNTTSFFREGNHFDVLKNALPDIMRLPDVSKRRMIRVWSVACSQGQEVYSIAMVLDDALRADETWRFRILGSDINTDVLKKASAGTYPRSALADIPAPYHARYFDRVTEDDTSRRIITAIRDRVIFRRINILKDNLRFRWPVDIVFCRNLLIYYTPTETNDIIDRIAGVMHKGGLLFLGHAESSAVKNKPFEYVANAVYRKGHA